MIRQTNVSSSRFKEYFTELVEKKFVKEVIGKRGEKYIVLTEKGFRYLEKYKVIKNFIEDFEL